MAADTADAPPPVRAPRHPLGGALRRARGAILWERAWPALAAISTAIGLFLIASWLGLWLMLPPVGRAIGVGLFALLLFAALFPAMGLRWPSRAESLNRLDRNSGRPHRPATAVADDLAPEAGDPLSAALWRAHVERSLSQAKGLKAGTPAPRLMARDPLALRGLVVLGVFAAFFVAGGERWSRLASAFYWQGAVTPANFRIDAWVTPPAYTGRPPVMLPGLRPGEPIRAATPVSVPAGSVLVVRASGKPLGVTLAGGLSDTPADAELRPATPGTAERRFTIASAGSASVDGEGLQWIFSAIPDRSPTIALTKEPEVQNRGALQLAYRVEDDYGVVEAKALFSRDESAAKTARPLYDALELPLSLPQARTRNGAAQTTKDLTEHPFAGTDMNLTLTARDEGGNEGKSEGTALKLPERSFTKALARALIEQRRDLALDANARGRVGTALDALALAPEQFTPEASIYLGLRSIYWQLNRARDDDGLRDVVTRLWQMAVQIEDGNVSDIEKALRAAQEELRQALERGASDEEIKRLMDQMRAAIDKFMQALAEELRKNPQMARPLDPDAMKNLRMQDLNSMLDRMEKLARSGAKDAAKQMLDQLSQMLENLQMARPGDGQEGDGDDMSQALNELGDMIRKQQQLRDRTFRQGQDQRRQQRQPPGQQGRQGQQQQGEQGMGGLQQDQQALREQLNKLLEQLRQRGMGQPGQDGQGSAELGDAGKSMGDAQGQLGDGNADGAVDSQGRALEAMRKGAQGMAQAMQQQMGQGPGQGPNGQPGRGQQRANQQTDPLGRPLRGRDYGDDSTVKVPGEIDVQRARRILEELRRRFGESFRPQLELDYIERLLKDF